MAGNKFFSAVFILTILSSCGSPIASEKVTPAARNLGGGAPTAPADGGSGTVVDSAGFFLSVYDANSALDNYKLHVADTSPTTYTTVSTPLSYSYPAVTSVPTVTGLSTTCKIADGLEDQDYTCVLEIEELDLYFNDVSIQFHVPSDMCSYVGVTPYSFWAYPPGNGPAIVSWEVSATGVITDGSNSLNGVPYCPSYDFSSNSGPNCCVGDYTQTVITHNSDGTSTSAVTDSTWSGAVSNCLAGPATKTQSKDANGFPKTTIYYVEGEGINKVYTISAAINETIGTHNYISNAWAANFYDPSDHGAVMRPEAMLKPPGVTTSSLQFLPNDSYEFACLDRAKEVINRIRLLVREWNTESIAESGDPDDTAASPLPGDTTNDFEDWKDFITTDGYGFPASNG